MLLDDASLQRISDAEVERLLLVANGHVASLLRMREQNPAAYAILVRQVR